MDTDTSRTLIATFMAPDSIVATIAAIITITTDSEPNSIEIITFTTTTTIITKTLTTNVAVSMNIPIFHSKRFQVSTKNVLPLVLVTLEI